jgi:hypothetical protein
MSWGSEAEDYGNKIRGKHYESRLGRRKGGTRKEGDVSE